MARGKEKKYSISCINGALICQNKAESLYISISRWHERPEKEIGLSALKPQREVFFITFSLSCWADCAGSTTSSQHWAPAKVITPLGSHLSTQAQVTSPRPESEMIMSLLMAVWCDTYKHIHICTDTSALSTHLFTRSHLSCPHISVFMPAGDHILF